jgi:hypothetical protein
MLLLAPKLVSSTRIGPDHEVVTVLNQVRANLQGTSMGAQVAPPWYQPSMDAELGGAQFAQWSLLIGGEDENPGFEPRPGDTYSVIPQAGMSGRSLVVKAVAQPTCEEDIFGAISLWDIPVCQIRVL